MFAPKLSAPLTKAIRTSEGILVWLTNIGLAAGALVDPTTLPPKEAAIVASAITGLHVASRTLLKVTALQQGAGIAAPVDDTDLMEHLASELADKLKLTVPAAVTVDGATVAKIVSAAIDAAGSPRAALHGVEDQVVSDAEEFANQPPATAADSPRPESAVKPDTPAAVPAQVVAQAVTAAQPPVAQAVPVAPGA